MGIEFNELSCLDLFSWTDSSTSILSINTSFSLLSSLLPPPPWVSFIWRSFIPHSKSLLVWRLFLDKIPTNEQLSRKGLFVVSKCSLCNDFSEGSIYLFFSCSFATKLWQWLSHILNLQVLFNSNSF